ncbi:MAG: hypothetical protein IBJ10_09970 [Phycisphaerales bacterium]|nr:hypothetical protein [Phycisphaerales bacterium]
MRRARIILAAALALLIGGEQMAFAHRKCCCGQTEPTCQNCPCCASGALASHPTIPPAPAQSPPFSFAFDADIERTTYGFSGGQLVVTSYFRDSGSGAVAATLACAGRPNFGGIMPPLQRELIDGSVGPTTALSVSILLTQSEPSSCPAQAPGLWTRLIVEDTASPLFAGVAAYARPGETWWRAGTSISGCPANEDAYGPGNTSGSRVAGNARHTWSASCSVLQTGGAVVGVTYSSLYERSNIAGGFIDTRRRHSISFYVVSPTLLPCSTQGLRLVTLPSRRDVRRFGAAPRATCGCAAH